MAKKVKKRAAVTKTRHRGPKKGYSSGVRPIPPGSYPTRLVSFDIETKQGKIALCGQQGEVPPKTLKAALGIIEGLRQEIKANLRTQAEVLKTREVEYLTLRLQATDHFANRILNVMEEGSKKGNFPIRNS